MTEIVVPTSEGVSLRQDVAGAGSRLAAGLLDGVVLLIGYLSILIFAMIPQSIDPTGLSSFVFGLIAGGAVLGTILYHALFHALAGGRTPGKRALGLRVASADGRPPTVLQVVLRALLWPIDVFFWVPAPLGLVLVAATPKHQRLGDLAAGTLVVRDGSARRRADPRSEPFPHDSWSRLPVRTLPLTPGAAAHLTPRDREILRDLVSRVGLDPDVRRRLFVGAAKHYCARLGLGSFADARDVLKELYLFARENAPTS